MTAGPFVLLEKAMSSKIYLGLRLINHMSKGALECKLPSHLSLLLASDGQRLCSQFPTVIRVSEEMCHVKAVKSLKRIHTLTLAVGHPTQSVPLGFPQ